ncbi:BTB/POZ domain protein [Talaromyces stipitatus ATCC 10500]|uniref:BTB/POZ domain protein n=1 Tax=Talaromyces stipitatus (strain ATCC 10500 / CBS 375.48 / QM 6759 / NRRL 1006) TaxID=441959 RepID=B8MFU4_TALSN|nr:BTB/POZ domain protein [Talaromyces stipitatus ATCC 10500]EED15811.1 BTB/POZ domain protein [Talaromyces stipitatus ATCC 10500]
MPEDKVAVIGSQDAQMQTDLGASIKSYILSAQFADLTIRTVDQEFKFHRLVVCGQSEYFSRLYKGEWTETNGNEVSLHDDDPCAIQAMIHFMYGFDYDSSGSEHSRAPPMLFNVKLYQIADKYVVPHRKQKAKEKFETIVQTCWRVSIPRATDLSAQQTQGGGHNWVHLWLAQA